ncbi:MAG: ATP-binding protein, partial [Chloroflexi bacterium]|nr:ATP-binding protein [Chloroflexota bacterium]
GAFLIIRQYFRSFALYRQQSLWLVIGALIPAFTNVFYLFELVPTITKDYTSISFALASTAFAVGIFRYHLFDLKPVARDAVIDSMRDPMLAVDARGRIVDVNPAAQAIIGIPAGAIIGRPAGEVLHPWRDLVERFRDQSDVQTEIVLDQAGVPHYYDLRVSPLTNRQGQLTGRLIVLRDINERQQAEVALRRYTVELEARNEELDAFAHTVAHDLKNPLASLIAYSDFLKAGLNKLSAADTDRFLGAIMRNGLQMNLIIDELLLLARVRQLEGVAITPLDMGAIVARALERLSALLAQRQAEVIVPPAWPIALGHGPWVEQVWANYVSNALKYGGARPRVELGANDHRDGPAGRPPMIRFWARDDGPGIPAEEQSKLFTLFTRLEGGQIEGHGLGLSIVQRIVNRLGGEVGVESQIGQGSLFWFTLPATPPKPLNHS